jgi:hypothetical protein
MDMVKVLATRSQKARFPASQTASPRINRIADYLYLRSMDNIEEIVEANRLSGAASKWSVST